MWFTKAVSFSYYWSQVIDFTAVSGHDIGALTQEIAWMIT